jgi:hypothetical protein
MSGARVTDNHHVSEPRVSIGWSPDEDETLIDRVCNPNKTLTRRGQVQLLSWCLCVALLVFVFVHGGHNPWVRVAGLVLVALVGLGVSVAVFGLWQSVQALHKRGRLHLPERVRDFLGRAGYGSPTALVAVLMLLVAVLAAVAYFAYGWLAAWAPAIVVGALTIAVTVTVVDGAFRAAERRRLEERRKPALRQISRYLYDYVLTEANEYGVWNPYGFPNSPIESFGGWMDLLVDAAHDGELPNGVVEHQQRVARQLANAQTLVDHLDRVRIRNGDVLSDDLNEAIDAVAPQLDEARELDLKARANVEEPYACLVEASSMTLRAVRDVVDAVQASGSGIASELLAELVVDIWGKSSEYALHRRSAHADGPSGSGEEDEIKTPGESERGSASHDA